MIYVGTFAKSIFPALRLGFVIVPSDLHDSFLGARRNIDIHPPMLEQMALTDFIVGGHYGRHLRRMRAAYRERLEALAEAIKHHCDGALRLRPVQAGLHAIGELNGVEEERVYEEARRRDIEVAPLGTYFIGPQRATGLLLGFAATRPEALRRGVERLAESIDAARKWPHRLTRSGTSHGRASRGKLRS